MKKLFVWISMIAITFTATSCIGWESGVVRSSTTGQSIESGIVSTKTDQIMVHQNTKIQARINQVSMQKWVEKDSVDVHVAVEIENVGQEKFKIEDITLQFISKEGEILKDIRSSKFDSYIPANVFPRILYPDDIGYFGYTYMIDATMDPEDIEKVDVTFYYTQTLQTRKELPILQKIEFLPIEKSEDLPNQIKANVAINDINEILGKEFGACLALFAEDNRLLAVLYKDRYVINRQPYQPKNKQITFDWPVLNKPDLYSKIKTTKGSCWVYTDNAYTTDRWSQSGDD